MEDRLQQVYAQLAKVHDPELDEPLTELGFISSVRVVGGTVSVDFKLATYWCAANFAFIMAEDIKQRVSELPWVERVEVRLKGHFFAEEINEAIAKGLSFAEAFPQLGAGDLTEVRGTFRRKAFLARQERLIELLLRRGLMVQQLARLSLPELEGLAAGDPELQAALERYRLILQELGLDPGDDGPALVAPDGTPLSEDELAEYRRRIAVVRRVMEFNSALCRELLAARLAREVAS